MSIHHGVASNANDATVDSHQHSQARPDADDRESKNQMEEEQIVKLEGTTYELSKGAHQKALRVAHSTFLKKMQSQTSELLVEYEALLVNILGTAMNDCTVMGEAARPGDARPPPLTGPAAVEAGGPRPRCPSGASPGPPKPSGAAATATHEAASGKTQELQRRDSGKGGGRAATKETASTIASSAMLLDPAGEEACVNLGLEIQLRRDDGGPTPNPSSPQMPSLGSPNFASPQSGSVAVPAESAVGALEAGHSELSRRDSLADLERERAGVFTIDAHQAAMDHLDENVYCVENFYKTSGFAQGIARSDWFGNLTLMVISCNAVYLGLDADHNTEDLLVDAAWGWILAENLFCIFFTFEIVVRFLAFENKRNCLVDGWFRFDSCLVALMILEVWGTLLLAAAGARLSGLPTAPLRLLRLLRLLRMVRLMRKMPELVTMVKGMRTASRAVASSCVMVLLLVYVFGIVMMMLLEPIYTNLGPPGDASYEHRVFVKESFDGLVPSMWTLLMDGSFMFGANDVLLHFREANHEMGYMAVLLFICFMLVSALTVLNMLIGILCEVVIAVGKAERNEADIKLVKKGILKELLAHDTDGSGTISQTELEEVMKSERAQLVLKDLEIDQASLETMHGMLYKTPGDVVSIRTILEICLMYRGGQPPTVKHIVDGMDFNRYNLELVKNEIHSLTRTMTLQLQNMALRQELQSSGAVAAGTSPSREHSRLAHSLPAED